MGNALLQAGRTNEAMRHFRKAVELSPDFWQAHHNLGSRYLLENRFDEARAEFETVLRLRPEFQPAKEALRRIDAAQPPLGPVDRP